MSAPDSNLFDNSTAHAVECDACSVIEARMRVNDGFLKLVNDLYCDYPSLFRDLRQSARSIHGEINRTLMQMLSELKKNI